MATYFIADVLNTGDWDIVDEFEANSDDEANAYAEERHSDLDWYVLDSAHENINT